MTPFALAVVGLRLVIVYITLSFLSTQFGWIVRMIIETEEVSTWQGWAYYFGGTALLAFLIAVGFWMLSKRAARLLVRGLDNSGENYELPAHQLLVVLLAVTGVNFFIVYFPAMAMNIFNLMRLDDAEISAYPINLWQRVFEHGVISLFATLLVVKAHRIGTWIQSLHR